MKKFYEKKFYDVMESNWCFYLQRSLNENEEKFLQRWVNIVEEIYCFSNYDDAFMVLLRDYKLFSKMTEF